MNPLAFELWGLSFHWYWLFYLLSFALVFYGGHALIRREYGRLSQQHYSQFCWVSWVALFIGARFFYVVAYYPDYFRENPLTILKIWTGGMSFHGGLLGVLLASFIVGRRLKVSLFHFSDLCVLFVPLGLMLGRVGNFINGELVGRVTEIPWAVIFSSTVDSLPRHPSQLYGAFAEGLFPFCVLFAQRKKLKIKAYHSTLFLLLYGVGRFIVGFFRAPDPQLGLVGGGLSLGQLFCLVMIFSGLFLEYRYQPIISQLKKKNDEL